MSESDASIHITSPEQKRSEPLTAESVSRWAADTAVSFMALDMNPRIVSGLTGEQHKPETQKALLDQEAAVVNHIMQLQIALVSHLQQGKDISDFSYSFKDSHAFAGGTFNVDEEVILNVLKNTLTHYKVENKGQVVPFADRSDASATLDLSKAHVKIDPASLNGLNVITSIGGADRTMNLMIAGEKATSAAVTALTPVSEAAMQSAIGPAEQKLKEIKDGQADAKARLEAIIAKLK